MQSGKVIDFMTPHPALIDPDSTLQDAANKMNELDCGVLPVGNENRLDGIITDRDIVVRAIVSGVNPTQERVADYMTDQVFYCNEDDSVEEAADQMQKHQVSRLVVKDGKSNVCGIITFGSILRKDNSQKEVAEVVRHALGKKAS